MWKSKLLLRISYRTDNEDQSYHLGSNQWVYSFTGGQTQQGGQSKQEAWQKEQRVVKLIGMSKRHSLFSKGELQIKLWTQSVKQFQLPVYKCGDLVPMT